MSRTVPTASAGPGEPLPPGPWLCECVCAAGLNQSLWLLFGRLWLFAQYNYYGLIYRLPGRGGCLGGPSTKSGVARGGPRVTRRPVLAVRACVPPGPPSVAHVRSPSCPAVPYFGDVLGDCPPPGPAHPFNAGESRTPFLSPPKRTTFSPFAHFLRGASGLGLLGARKGSQSYTPYAGLKGLQIRGSRSPGGS
jgi:hypothetical protein